MTLTELARLAHVSTSTASKAFAQSSEINQETKEMIFEVAKQNGCFKKFYRAEYPGLSFAIICPEFESTYYSVFIAEMQKYLAKYNSEVSVAVTGFDAEVEERLIEYYERFHTVDGIILINGHSNFKAKNEIPIATISCVTKSKPSINVKQNLQFPIFEAVSRLHELGAESIGFIGEGYTIGKKRLTLDTVKKVYGEANEDYFVTSHERFERAGYLGALELISKGKLPRAIICGYDSIALGAMRAFFEHGIKVPDDVAVIGIDDPPSSAYTTPSLSSISHQTEETCKAVASALMAKIKGEEYPDTIDIICKFNERESSKIKK